MENEQDVTSDSSPASVEGSQPQQDTALVSEPVEATTQQAAQEKVSPSIPYDRFQEVVKEKNELKEIVKTLAQRQAQGETHKQVEQDPYVGLDAEQERFYRSLDSRVKNMIHQEAKKISEPILQQNQILMHKVGTLLESDFRQKFKDVTPNSTEEQQIIAKINAGYSPEDAVWAVMGPKRVEFVKTQQVKTQQVKIQQKMAANQEIGLPSQSAIPKGTKLSFREELERRAKEAGI